jgi:hypothetical protein
MNENQKFILAILLVTVLIILPIALLAYREITSTPVVLLHYYSSDKKTEQIYYWERMSNDNRCINLLEIHALQDTVEIWVSEE